MVRAHRFWSRGFVRRTLDFGSVTRDCRQTYQRPTPRGTVLYVVAVVGGIHGSGSFVLVETQLKDFYRTATCGLTMISTGLYSDPCAPIGEDAVSAFVGSMGFHERR
jgi:hypothetical protein